MADFARIEDSRGVSLWINLDYVTRIEPGLDPREETLVRFAVGRALRLSASQGGRLAGQLNRCCIKRRED
jgi:hypothetical protein